MLRFASPLSLLLSLLCCLGAGLGLGSGIAQAEPQADAGAEVPILNVQGSAEVRATPDEATVRLGVLAQEPTAREAQAQANEIAAGILAGLEGLDIPESEIQTSELRLSPVYGPPPKPQPTGSEPEEPKIVAYRATNVVTVRLDELAKVGPAIDAGLEAGANRLEGVTFGLQDDLPVRQEALRKAVAEAQAKARALAQALDVELGEVLQVNEGGVSVRTPRFSEGMSMMRVEAASVAPTPVAAGQITVTAEVSIRYRIGP